MTDDEILTRAREIERERTEKNYAAEAARERAEAVAEARALLAAHDKELATGDKVASAAEIEANRRHAERVREDRATAGEQWKIGAPEDVAPPSQWIADPACSVQIGKFRKRGEAEGVERGIVLVALGTPDFQRVFGMEHDRAMVIGDALIRAAKAAAELNSNIGNNPAPTTAPVTK